MAFKQKLGRPRVNIKVRDLRAIAPKGFAVDKVDEKNKLAYYKRVK